MTNVIDSKECRNVYIEIAQDKGGSYKVTASENGKIFDKKTYGDESKAKARFRSMCKKYCTNESLIKEIDNSNAVQLKTESKNFTGYLVKSATGQKKFWNPSSSYVNYFAKKESAIKKLYQVIAKLPEYAFYDEDEMYDFEDADELADAEFAKFYITDASGKKIIEDITEEVKEHLLSDEEFVSKVIEDDDDYFDDEDDLDECKEMSAMGKKLTIREAFEDEYMDSQGYLTEDHADYMESAIYIPVSVFTKKTNYIVEYIIEEAIRSNNARKISINDYKMAERQDNLVELDEDEEVYSDTEDVTLYVRFIVDENGEYDFNEYGIGQSVSNIKGYVLREIGY